MGREYDHTSIRIWMEYKMYERMTESDDVCTICLEPIDEGGGSSVLADKFACQCKHKVHDGCLEAWVMTRVGPGTGVGCIVCRQPVGVWNVQQTPSIQSEGAVINVRPSAREERLRTFLQEQLERQENMIAVRMRVAGVFCVCVIILLLLLSLAGVIS